MATVTGYQSGLNCALYIDGSGVGGSSWSEVDDAANVSQSSQRNQGTVKNRSSSYELFLPGQISVEHTVTVTLNRGDTALATIKTAYDAGTILGVAAMTGTITDINEIGYQYDALVTSFNMEQGIDDAVELTIGLRPHANYGTAPSHATISA